MKTANDLHRYRATGRTAYLVGAEFDTPEGFIKNIIPGMVYALYSPMPHQLNDINKEIIPFLEAIVFMGFSLIILFNIPTLNILTLTNWRRSAIVFIIAYFVLFSIVFGIVDSNIGTAYRHRIQATFLIVILVAPVLSQGYRRYSDKK